MAKIRFPTFKIPFLQRVVYLDDEAHELTGDNKNGTVSCRKIEELPAGSARKYPVLILGKSLYYETVKPFPIASSQDVKDAVEMEREELCPFPSGKTFVLCIKKGENQTLAGIWFVKADVLDRIAPFKPYYVIPETALLTMGHLPVSSGPASDQVHSDGNGRIVRVVKATRNLFCFLSPKGICSSFETRSGDVDTARKYFRRMVGQEARDAGESALDFPQPYLDVLYRTFRGASIRKLLPFQFHNPFRLDPPQKKAVARGLAAALILVCCHLVVLSFLLDKTARDLEVIHSARRTAFASFTRQEERIKAQQEIYSKLAQRISNYPSKVALFNKLSEKLPDEAVIVGLKVIDREVEIKGKAARASDILDIVNGAEGIEGARFVSGIQKAGDKDQRETFTVGFRLK